LIGSKLNWPLLLAIITGPFGLAILAITTFKDQIIEVFSIIYNGIKATMGFIANVITAPFKAAFNADRFLVEQHCRQTVIQNTRMASTSAWWQRL
jgi:hypothetical protein